MSLVEQGRSPLELSTKGNWHRVEIGEEERQHIERFARGVAVAVIVVRADRDRDPHHPSLDHPAQPRKRAALRRALRRLAGDFALDPVHPEVEAYVQELGADAAAEMDLPAGLELEIIIEGDEVNAFATLGGHIFVLEGLIEQLDNETASRWCSATRSRGSRDPLTSLSRGFLLQLLCPPPPGTRAPPGTWRAARPDGLQQELEETADELALAALQRRTDTWAGPRRSSRTSESWKSSPPDSWPPTPTSRAAPSDRRSFRRAGWTAEATASYPDAVLEAQFWALRRPSESRKLPVMIMMMSTSVQIPSPPRVNSIKAVPTFPA